MSRFPAVLVTTLALAIPASTLAAPAGPLASPSLIVIGESIGPIRLGVPASEVVKLFGKPRSTKRFEFASGEVGRVAAYRKHGGAFLVTYANGVVVGISTAARFYRTASGVGPGSPRPLAAALPGFRFDQCTAGYSRQTGGTLTLFNSYAGPRLISHAEIYRTAFFDC
jgi:hypothetical protein